MSLNKTIVFQGMCYSGKSTLGKMTADALGVSFLSALLPKSSQTKNLGPATLRLMNNHAIIATSAIPKVAFKSALAGRIQ